MLAAILAAILFYVGLLMAQVFKTGPGHLWTP